MLVLFTRRFPRSYIDSLNGLLRSYSSNVAPLTVGDAIDTFVNILCANNEATSRFCSFIKHTRPYADGNLPKIANLCSKIALIRKEVDDLEYFTRNKKDMGDDELENIAMEDIRQRGDDVLKCVTELAEVAFPAVGAEIDAATIEIAAGIGGQEAMIWANDLFQMYEKVCPNLGLKFNAIEYDHTEIGGARKAFANVSGPFAFKILRFEGGIHRVQRVPRTERAGRIHTSTAAVVVMPQPNDIQVAINPSDLTITTFRSSGPGGQHVNRTDSAVRIVHNPSGIIVTCQEERSQFRNKDLAMSKLRSILYERELDSKLSNERANRRLQAGTKARSEKIRTYNWPRRRIIDHRLPSDMTGSGDLDDAMNGGKTLVHIIEALQATDREDRIMAMVQQFCSFK